MRKRIFTAVCINLTCATVFTACEFERPKKTGTEIKMPDKIAAAETLSEPVTEKVERKIEKKEISSHSVPLTVIVDNLKSPDAPVEMSVYGPDNKFLDVNDQIKKYRFNPKKGKLVAKIHDIPYGEFAMALYQDVNGDGRIDKDIIGIPEEPYAFSNNYKPVIKAPSFNDCKFEYNEKTNTINISLIK